MFRSLICLLHCVLPPLCRLSSLLPPSLESSLPLAYISPRMTFSGHFRQVFALLCFACCRLSVFRFSFFVYGFSFLFLVLSSVQEAIEAQTLVTSVLPRFHAGPRHGGVLEDFRACPVYSRMICFSTPLKVDPLLVVSSVYFIGLSAGRVDMLMLELAMDPFAWFRLRFTRNVCPPR